MTSSSAMGSPATGDPPGSLPSRPRSWRGPIALALAATGLGCGPPSSKSDDPPPASAPQSVPAEPREPAPAPEAPPAPPPAPEPPPAILHSKVTTKSGNLTSGLQCKDDGSCRADVFVPGAGSPQTALELSITDSCLAIGVEGRPPRKAKNLRVEALAVRVLPDEAAKDEPAPSFPSALMLIGNCTAQLQRVTKPPMGRVLMCDLEASARFVCRTTTAGKDGAWSKTDEPELTTEASQAICVDTCAGTFTVRTDAECACASGRR